MARPDLSDMGMRLKGSTKNTLTFDTTELESAVARLRAALVEAGAAWSALPRGIQQHLGPITITLGADDGPDTSE